MALQLRDYLGPEVALILVKTLCKSIHLSVRIALKQVDAVTDVSKLSLRRLKLAAG